MKRIAWPAIALSSLPFVHCFANVAPVSRASRLLSAAPGSRALRLTATTESVAETAVSRDTVKEDLLAMCSQARMGRDQSSRESVRLKVEALERVNPTPKPLEAPELLTACWRLVYTTSASILGTRRLRPFRPRPRILQSIDAGKLAAKNEEWVLMGLLRNLVRGDLEPRDDGRTVDIQFKKFGIGWLRVRAPKSARGFLETTYLDDDMRISRSGNESFYVFVREGQPRI